MRDNATTLNLVANELRTRFGVNVQSQVNRIRDVAEQMAQDAQALTNTDLGEVVVRD